MTSSKPGRALFRPATSAVALTALIALAALTACSSGATPGDEEIDRSVSVSMLPPISQPGLEVADPEDAQPVVAARFDQDSAGREASLEQSASGDWDEVATAEVDEDGVAEFVVEGGADDEAPYRVVAAASGDLPAAQSPEVSGGSWGEPVFADAFDGEELGDEWYHRAPDYNPDGLRRCSKGSPNAVTVGGGTATLRVVDDPARDDSCEALKGNGKSLGTFDYRLNGHIATDEYFLYGVSAARIKFQREPGQHGSFWMQSDVGLEIDIVEYFGDDGQGRLASFVYYPTPEGFVKEGDWIEDAADFLADQDDDWWKSYHVFALERSKEYYTIRIDGKEAWRTDQGVQGHPEFIVLSLLSSDYELPNLPEGGLPQAMEVDWVRHWDTPTG